MFKDEISAEERAENPGTDETDLGSVRAEEGAPDNVDIDADVDDLDAATDKVEDAAPAAPLVDPALEEDAEVIDLRGLTEHQFLVLEEGADPVEIDPEVEPHPLVAKAGDANEAESKLKELLDAGVEPSSLELVTDRNGRLIRVERAQL